MRPAAPSTDSTHPEHRNSWDILYASRRIRGRLSPLRAGGSAGSPRRYFTRVTGTVVRCSTLFATEPNISPVTVPSPRVAMMISSQW